MNHLPPVPEWTAERLAQSLERLTPRLRRQIRIHRQWARLLDVDDVLQVTFTEAFLSLDRVRASGDDELLAWLRSGAENNLRDAVRALSAKRRVDGLARLDPAGGAESEAGFLERLLVATTTPSRTAVANEAQEALRAAVGALPETYRAVAIGMMTGKNATEQAMEMRRTTGALHMLRARVVERLTAALMGHVTPTR